MFDAAQRLRFAIAILLSQKSAKSQTPIVPHGGSRSASDHPSSLLDSPAKIDVITCLAIFGIKPARTFKRPPVKGHVTTGNVLGNCISEQNMTWTARRRRNARLNPILCWRRDVRSANSGVIAAYECADQIIQPIHVCHAVRIGIGEHFASGSGGPGVAGVAQPMVALMNVADLRELRRNVGRVVR